MRLIGEVMRERERRIGSSCPQRTSDAFAQRAPSQRGRSRREGRNLAAPKLSLSLVDYTARCPCWVSILLKFRRWPCDLEWMTYWASHISSKVARCIRLYLINSLKTSKNSQQSQKWLLMEWITESTMWTLKRQIRRKDGKGTEKNKVTDAVCPITRMKKKFYR